MIDFFNDLQSWQEVPYHLECLMTARQPISEEAERILMEKHEHIIAMWEAMTMAEDEAMLIWDVDVRDATIAAIEGAIAAAPLGNLYSVALSACLNAIGRIAGESYDHFMNARAYLQEADCHAKEIDRLQAELNALKWK